MEHICWNCKYFVADDSETLLSGRCRRNAPKNIDYNSANIRTAYSFLLQMEYLAGGVAAGGVILPLFAIGENTLPLCHATDVTGMDANDISPFIIPYGGFYINGAVVTASRMNSGAATVGTPTLKIQQIYIRGANQEPVVGSSQFEIPIDPTKVQISGVTTDVFIQDGILFETPTTKVALGNNLTGFRLDLTGSTEDDIAEIRNLKIGLICSRPIDDSLSPVTSSAKFAFLYDGSTQNCGEFVPTNAIIPVIPVIE